MRVRTVTWMVVATCLMGPLALRCGAQLTLAWNPPSSAGLAGYNVCWGTNSGIYLHTNYCPQTQTNLTISNLATNEVFFFALMNFLSQSLDYSDNAFATDATAFAWREEPFFALAIFLVGLSA